MDFFTIQYIVYTAGLFISIACVVIAELQKPSQEQKLVLMMSMITALIMLGYWGTVQVRISNIHLLIYANKIQYLGACSSYFIMLLLYLRYYRLRMPSVVYWSLFTLTLALLVITLTFDHTRLFYKSFNIEYIAGQTVLLKNFGPMHTVFVLMVIGYSTAFTCLFIKRLIVSEHCRRKMIVLFYLIIMIPTFGYLFEKLFKLDVVKPGSFGLLITDSILLYLIIVKRFCDVGFLARSMIFNSLSDAVVILDNRNQLLECNTIAAKLFPFLEKLPAESKLKGLNIDFEIMFSPIFGRDDIFPVDRPINGRIYHPAIDKVFDNNHVMQGNILWLRDATDIIKREEILKETSHTLESMVTAKTQRILEMQDQMVLGFSTLVENRNQVTGQHIKRTSSYVSVIANELLREKKFSGTITGTWITTLRKVAPLHDIGKMSVPESILDKPGKLTSDEFSVMKKHTQAGARIIDYTMHDNVDPAYFHMAEEVANFHHERWDGSGYPEGLAGDAIPLAARIMSVADVFDALVSDRSYKPAYSFDQAFSTIVSESGKQFDPLVVTAFVQCRQVIFSIYSEYRD